jgi:hypothetical protein
MYKAEATDKAHSTTAERMVKVLRNLPEAGDLVQTRGEGVVSRTIGVVA